MVTFGYLPASSDEGNECSSENMDTESPRSPAYLQLLLVAHTTDSAP